MGTTWPCLGWASSGNEGQWIVHSEVSSSTRIRQVASFVRCLFCLETVLVFLCSCVCSSQRSAGWHHTWRWLPSQGRYLGEALTSRPCQIASLVLWVRLPPLIGDCDYMLGFYLYLPVSCFSRFSDLGTWWVVFSCALTWANPPNHLREQPQLPRKQLTV